MGAGGVAVGVHTTQFEIHDHEAGFYQPILELAMEEVRRFSNQSSDKSVCVAGIIGKTPQSGVESQQADNPLRTGDTLSQLG